MLKSRQIKNLEHLKILNLSHYEAIVFDYLINNKDDQNQNIPSTPLTISKETNIPRASVYVTLESLEKRGLVTHKKLDKKKVWVIQNQDKIRESVQVAQNILTGLSADSSEMRIAEGVHGIIENKNIILHVGAEAVRETMFKIFRQHNDEHFYGYMGDRDVISAWDTVFTRGEVDEMNRIIKNNKLICVGVFPKGFAREAFLMYGAQWARDYMGRTASTSYADTKYFTNSGQMFAFRDAMYLIDLSDKMIIEIRHSNIQKMILSMYTFMLENGERVDINAELRGMIEESEFK